MAGRFNALAIGGLRPWNIETKHARRQMIVSGCWPALVVQDFEEGP
jgi:hypothetical protein